MAALAYCAVTELPALSSEACYGALKGRVKRRLAASGFGKFALISTRLNYLRRQQGRILLCRLNEVAKPDPRMLAHNAGYRKLDDAGGRMPVGQTNLHTRDIAVEFNAGYPRDGPLLFG